MIISYWHEPIQQQKNNWLLFMASCENGLLMSGLGEASEKQQVSNLAELEQLAKRYLPEHKLEKDKTSNIPILQQFEAYFQKQLQTFTFSLYPQGTAFQRRVWQQLIQIPYGETASYSDIADAVNCPTGQRAVGMANHYNPLGIVVPCHRVIGKNGKLTG
jgi:methylated-DNA-[protein]-cysteine S-methyltransferase